MKTLLLNYPDVMTVEQVQNLLQIGRTTMYKLIHNNEIKFIRVGKNYRIPKKYLTDFLSYGRYVTDNGGSVQ